MSWKGLALTKPQKTSNNLHLVFTRLQKISNYLQSKTNN